MRTILGVIAGLLASMLLMFGVEAVATALFPPPPGLDLRNEADLARLVALAPFGMKALVVFGWALASLAAAGSRRRSPVIRAPRRWSSACWSWPVAP